MRLQEVAGLLDGIEDDPAALRELAAHWELAGHWNDNATWTADDLMAHAEACTDSRSGRNPMNQETGLTMPEGWEA